MPKHNYQPSQPRRFTRSLGYQTGHILRNFKWWDKFEVKKSREYKGRGSGLWTGQNLSFSHIHGRPKHVSLGNCKRRRREAAIAEGKKPLPTRRSGRAL